jgi:low temperature requirement protein LtrA
MSAEELASSQRADGETIEPGDTRLELFFDLVFVFAFTQITGFIATHLSWFGVLQGAVLLAALWWAWASYSWLTSAIPAEDVILARLIILSAMAMMLIASLAVPDAFGEYGVLFGVAYFIVRFLHVALYLLATRDTPQTRQAILRLSPGFLGGPALLVVAGFLDGPAKGVFWAAALLLDYGAPLVHGVEDFHIQAVHFAERHGSVIIIALGESITAIGAAAELHLEAVVILGALLAITLSAALGWAYFDYVALAAERKLDAAQGHELAGLARDSYSYLHLPMVAGIILVALGIEEALPHVEDPLGTIPALALCGGTTLYLLGLNAFRLRNTGTVSIPRLVAAALCCALVPMAVVASALATLAIFATLLSGLVAYETVHPNKLRRKVREQ